MSVHPIREAFELAGDQPSAEFRDALRVRFLAELSVPVATAMPSREETIMTITEESHHTEPHRKESRRRAVLGVAAALIVVTGLTVVLINRRSETDHVDTSKDPAIAKEALVGDDEIGSGWLVSHARDNWTSPIVASQAATIDECAPYLDYAFDSPNRKAVTSGKVFEQPSLYWTTQWVYLFPTEAAASEAMDKISEPGFAPCLNRLREKMYNVNPRGAPTTVTTVDAVPMLPHGDRQIVLGQHGTFGSFGNLSFTIMNVFVQVGRGIVYVDPNPDFHKSTDPAGPLEKVVSAATDHLATALAGQS